MKKIYIYLISLLIAQTGCKTSQTADQKKTKTQNREKVQKYQEDLSILRPSFQDSLALLDENSNEEEKTSTLTFITPQHDITKEMDVFFKEMAEKNEEYELTGYAVQIYLGNDRDRAMYIKNKAENIFLNSGVNVLFESSFYKVRVGNFYDRIKAHKVLNKAQHVFKDASLIPVQLSMTGL